MEKKSRPKGKQSSKRKEMKESETSDKNKNVTIKVGLIGETHAGKTSLMVKYVEDRFDEDYIETLGVNFLEKTVKIKNLSVTLSVWDLGGQREYLTLMPIVCNDAKIFLFVFDLTRKQSLFMVKDWFQNAKRMNKFAYPFLIGTKFDLYNEKDNKFKVDITTQARKFAKAMRAPLIYCSSKKSINIKKIFQIVIAKVFKLRPKVAEVKKCAEPIIEYKTVWARKAKKEKRKKVSTRE